MGLSKLGAVSLLLQMIGCTLKGHMHESMRGQASEVIFLCTLLKNAYLVLLVHIRQTAVIQESEATCNS